jgi:hypothetical protein
MMVKMGKLFNYSQIKELYNFYISNMTEDIKMKVMGDKIVFAVHLLSKKGTVIEVPDGFSIINVSIIPNVKGEIDIFIQLKFEE